MEQTIYDIKDNQITKITFTFLPQSIYSFIIYTGFDNNTKLGDSNAVTGKIAFSIVTIILTGIVFLMAIFNIYYLAKNHRFKNISLFGFYIFSISTLFCNF